MVIGGCVRTLRRAKNAQACYGWGAPRHAGRQPARAGGPLEQLGTWLMRALAGYLAGFGQFSTARRLVERFLNERSPRGEPWAIHAQLLFRWAMAIDPRRGDEVHELLATALSSYRRAAEREPCPLEVHRELALVLLRLAWLRGPAPDAETSDLLLECVQECDLVLRAQPRRADVLHERALARASLRSQVPIQESSALLTQALGDLDASLELRPHAAETVFHRAQMAAELAGLQHHLGQRRQELGLRHRVLEDLAHLRQMRADGPEARLLAAATSTALARLGDSPEERAREAIDVASALLTENPRNVRASLVRAEARLAAACRFAASGDERGTLVYRQAAADYEAAMAAVGLRGREDVQATYARARMAWGVALAQGGDLEQARELLTEALEGCEQAVDDDPHDPERLLARGETQLALGELAPDGQAPARFAAAREDAQRVLELVSQGPRALALRARAELALGQGDQALQDARAARRLAPEDRKVLRAEREALLAAALGASGDRRAQLLREALASCREALELDAREPRAHYDEARALYLAGRPAAAYQALEQALQLSPGLRIAARQEPTWADVRQEEGFRRLVGEL